MEKIIYVNEEKMFFYSKDEKSLKLNTYKLMFKLENLI